MEAGKRIKRFTTSAQKTLPLPVDQILTQLEQGLDMHFSNTKYPNIVPPFVTYTLTKSGNALKTVINAMAEWA